MVQVDVFWGYGWGASLAVASARLLRERGSILDSRQWADTLIFLSLFWAPTGLLLLIRHPSWETMQAASDFGSMSEWIILSFGITNVTQGMLGFWVGQKLMNAGRYHWAQLNWIVGYYGMFFILLYGWDGLGYDRFLYDRDMWPGSPAWTPGVATGDGVLAAIWTFVSNFSNAQGNATVITTLLTDGLWLIPPFAWLFYRWYRRDAVFDGARAPGFVGMYASYLGGVFIVGLGCAAISALTVHAIGTLAGIGDVIWHDGFYAPQNLVPHVISYLVGIPLSLVVMWFVLLAPGRPLFALLRPLMAGADARGLRQV